MVCDAPYRGRRLAQQPSCRPIISVCSTSLVGNRSELLRDLFFWRNRFGVEYRAATSQASGRTNWRKRTKLRKSPNTPWSDLPAFRTRSVRRLTRLLCFSFFSWLEAYPVLFLAVNAHESLVPHTRPRSSPPVAWPDQTIYETAFVAIGHKGKLV